jgi:uncharacterized protein YecT (DUF1311 family)
MSAQASDFECNYQGSQLEMNACAIRDYKTADALMKKILAHALLKEHPERLINEQNVWMTNRDAKCRPKRNQPGHNGTIDYFTCMQRETELRTLRVIQH